MHRVGNEKLSAKTLVLPMAAHTTILEASMVAINEDGYAVEATKAPNLKAAGSATWYAQNTDEDGKEKVTVKRGAFVWNNDGSIKETDILKDAYIADARTVTITAEGSSIAGKILAVDADGVTVEML